MEKLAKPKRKVILIGDFHVKKHFNWVKDVVRDLKEKRGITRLGIESPKGETKKYEMEGFSKFAKKFHEIAMLQRVGSLPVTLSKEYRQSLTDLGMDVFEYDAPPSVWSFAFDLTNVDTVVNFLELIEIPRERWNNIDLGPTEREAINKILEIGDSREFKNFLEDNKELIRRVKGRRKKAKEEGLLSPKGFPVTDVSRFGDKYIHPIREGYFVRNLARKAEKGDVLAIMGKNHLERVKKRLEDKGIDVEIIRRDET